MLNIAVWQGGAARAFDPQLLAPLQFEEIKHHTPNVGRPQSNGYTSYCTRLGG